MLRTMHNMLRVDCFFLAVLATQTTGQDYSRWSLPQDARVRLGKGRINEVQYSSDGTRLAVASFVGSWLYNTVIYQEGKVYTVALSPNRSTLVSRGAHKHTLTTKIEKTH